ELNIAEGRAAATILAAAIIDDILGLVVLATVAGWEVPSSSPIALLVPMVATIAAAAIRLRFLPVHLDRVMDALHFRGGGPAGAFGLVLGAAWFVQTVGGLAGITGAYLAGVALADVRLGAHVREHVERTVELILAPAFFVAIGVTADLRAGAAAVPFILALIAVAIVTKVVGCAIGARLGGLAPAEAGLVGIGMIARGEVALVAATLGQQVGLIDTSLYSSVVVMTLVTTVAAPIGMAAWCRLMARREAQGRAGLPAGSIRPEIPVGVPVMASGGLRQSLGSGSAFSNAVRVEVE
ncbi:MAG TPA: cation:proton antiporter, partial [Candidatus Acidoferrum sp.]|nr:cation:proton antiporter [Candidatus Acidoferrum sp.]